MQMMEFARPPPPVLRDGKNCSTVTDTIIIIIVVQPAVGMLLLSTNDASPNCNKTALDWRLKFARRRLLPQRESYFRRTELIFPPLSFDQFC